MKFHSIIVFLAFVCSEVIALDKQELTERAQQLESKIDSVVEKIKESDPGEAQILKDERVQLGLIVLNLEWADSTQMAQLEKKFNALANKIENQLSLIEQGKSITAIPTHTTKRATHSTKIPLKTTARPLTTSGVLGTTSSQRALSCEANTVFFDKLFSTVNKMNDKINSLTQQHKGSEALVLVDKVHQILDWEKQLETLVKQVNSLVDQVNKLEESLSS